jgi:hypothetical protein
VSFSDFPRPGGGGRPEVGFLEPEGTEFFVVPPVRTCDMRAGEKGKLSTVMKLFLERTRRTDT